MKKPITIKLPKCAKCKKQLEPQFTTEQQEGDIGKPKVLMMYGVCKECGIITMCEIIDIKKIIFEGLNK